MMKKRVCAAAMALSMSLALPVCAANVDRNYNTIAAGMSHSIALTEEGKVYTWGSNASGQLGRPGEEISKHPEMVNVKQAVAVAAGYNFSAALGYDGGVQIWGCDTFSTPTDLGLSDVVEIDAGQANLLCLQADGSVWQWNLGAGLSRVEGVSNVAEISAGGHNMALTKDGRVYTWGPNHKGQLGCGTTYDSNWPMQVPLLNVVDISAGFSHSLAVTFSGEVYAWGANDYGQLGNGTTTDSLLPVKVSNLKNCTRVSAGNGSSLAIDKVGKVFTWGYGEFGQMGSNGSNGANASNPRPGSGFKVGGGAVAADSGVNHCLAVDDNGNLFAWGRNKDGQLGNGKDSNQSSPNRIMGQVDIAGSNDADTIVTASKWAQPEIWNLYTLEVAPPMLWSKYQSNITRGEFAALLVSVYENVKDHQTSADTTDKYTDLEGHSLERDIRKAVKLGILNGTSPTTINPNGMLTREQGAKMLCAFVAVMENANISQRAESLAFYADARDISSWAAPYVFYAHEHKIMLGDAMGNFNPLGSLTREQSLVTVARLMKNYGWAK